MKRVAMFEKVSFEQFKKDWIETFGENWLSDMFGHIESLEEIYENIKIPRRMTKGSMGYDIFSPITFSLEPNETVKLPTGLRCYIEEGWGLIILPRSGHGCKFRLQLDNTLPAIDQDYYYSDNEGHIKLKLTNDTKENKTFHIEAGKGLVQGIFLEYGITMDDVENEIRNGGWGSTDKN